MINIDQVNFENKRVVVRVDFNVPLDENFNITDDTRMRAAMPTIQKVINDKGMLILMSHLGRPKKNPDPKFSMKPILAHLKELVGKEVAFAEDCAKAADMVAAMQPGDVLLLENLRFYAEEEGKPRGIEKGEEGYDEAKKALKASQKEFTKTLASYGDYYINDAFGTAHRAHASTALIADYFDQSEDISPRNCETFVQHLPFVCLSPQENRPEYGSSSCQKTHRFLAKVQSVFRQTKSDYLSCANIRFQNRFPRTKFLASSKARISPNCL